jgi:hypothetical protein
MRKTIAILTALVALAVAAVPASAASGVKYKGKTSSGHPIRFTLKNNRLYNMESGIATQCVAIQGGGAPMGGADTFSYKGWAKLTSKPNEFTFVKKPGFWWKEVTTKHTLTSKLNRRTKVITGTQRLQYEFLVPKFTPGTFSIYSCLGSGKFKAKPVK